MALRRPLSWGLKRAPAPFTGGNRVEILTDGGPFFRALLAAIESAEHYVLLESYIVVADDAGWRVARALAARSRAGVEVAFCFDGYGSMGLDPELIRHLEDAGVKLLAFRPISVFRRIWPWSKRNHRKTLVADGQVGIVGGLNLASEYLPLEEGGEGWRDTAVRVEGPAVAELESMFRNLWAHEKGPVLERLPKLPARFPGGEQARFLGNYARRDRAFIRRAYLLAIFSAQRTIRICNAYFIPDRVIRRALIRAAQRGVTVEIIVAGRTDVPPALYATRSYYSRFLGHGIRIYEWHDRVLHAKTAVIDGEWSTIGSFNLDYLSSFRNLEVNAAIIGKRIGGAMDDQFEADRARSRRIDLALWKVRPLSMRLFEWIFRALKPKY